MVSSKHHGSWWFPVELQVNVHVVPSPLDLKLLVVDCILDPRVSRKELLY